MINSILKNHKEIIRYIVVIVSISILCFLTYYFEIIIKVHIIYTHWFYFPIILACYWWKKKGLIVPLLLSGNLIFFSFLGGATVTVIIEEFGRIIIITIVGLSVSILSEIISKNEQYLSESKKKYRDLANSLPQVVCEIDKEGNLIFINDNAFKTFGYTRDDFDKGLNSLQMLIPGERKRAFKNFINVSKRGKLSEDEHMALRKDGSTFPISLYASPIIHNNKFIGIRAILIDITEQKKAEQKLKESEEKYRYFFDNAQVGLYWSRISDGKFLECNDTFAKIVGYDTREECLADYVSLEHYVDLNMRNKMVEEIRINNEVKDFEIHVTKRDGTPYWASISARIDLKENRLEGAAIDITVRKKAEQSLRETLEDLARINTELEQFSYVASHDLKEPLRMISSFAQLLEKRYKDKLDDDANDFIGFITEGVVRMQDLINNLLDYSKIGKLNREFEKIDLNDVLKDVIDNLRRIINETNAEIIFDSLPNIYGDKYQLLQVFQNLILNAIKFRGIDFPLISISVHPEGKHWVFSISDNGIGIDSKDFERIFIIFKRLNRTGKYEGTGIGLAICKKIIEYHRGKIWVESEVGKGSTFNFSIPKEIDIKS